MTACPPDEQLVELIEGTLAAEVGEAIEAHVDTCRSCAALIAGFAEATFDRGDEAPPLGPGARIGRYFVVRFVGAGAMGMVYAAYDPQLDRKIALKLIRPAIGGIADHRARLIKEAKALARVNHPNVTAIYDAGADRAQVFLAMELVDGDTLEAWLRAEPRTTEEVIGAVAAAGRGLAAVHAAGLVHRDFKPANVLVDRDGEVKVTDFGLARPDDTAPFPPALPETFDLYDAAIAATLTQPGVIAGTPRYMAPEQLRGKPADAVGDQFAFAVTLAEAVYGAPPFPGATIGELMAGYDAGLAPRFTAVPVPVRVRAAIERGLAADPAARFPDLDAMLAELVVRPRARAAAWLVAVGAIAAVALAIVGVRAHATAPGPCDGAGHELAAVWHRARAAAIMARFRATGLPDAERSAAAANAELDRRATAIAAMSVDTCQATRQRGTQSETVHALRTGCLARRGDELDALATALAHGDAAAVRAAPALATARDAIAECADVDALRAVDRPQPGFALAVDALTHELAAPTAAIATGHPELAIVPLRALAATARARHVRPLEARAALALATADEPTAAITDATTAVYAAIAGRDDRTLLAACALLAATTGAEPWRACATGVAERLHLAQR